MKHIIYIFLILCLCIATIQSQQVFSNADLTITKLEDGLWVIETVDKASMYIIEGRKKAMLIDTGTKCEKLDEVVRNITKKPLYVVITHMHLDHAGNIEPFQDVYYHPADTPLLSRLKTYHGNVHFLSDGDIFDLGNKKIEVVHTPGHTPGSVVFIDHASKNCFTGDAFGSGQVWLQLWPFSPMKTYIASCKKMEKIMNEGIANVYCGHYPHVKGALHKDYITNMRILAEAIDNGTAPDPIPFDIRIPQLDKNPVSTELNGVKIVYEPSEIK